MPYNAEAVANAFLELAKRDGKRLTNMQLQKLVYIAHGWSLALLRKPLLDTDVQAWEWGPVIPKLYNRLKKYGAGYVTELIPSDDTVDPDSEEMSIIERVWEAYGDFNGPQLSAITHTEGTPWSLTWKSRPYGEIERGLIAQHYLQLLDERVGTENATS